MNAQAAEEIRVAQVSGSPKPGATLVVDQVTPKVLRAFYKTYGELSNVRWWKSDDGYAASFKLKGITNTIYYQRSGLVDASIHFYFEEQLAAPVKSRVNSLFPNYSITNVTEVQKGGITAFYVKIHDATTIKTVKLVGGEWVLFENLVKS
jgi:hypothetical protein